MYCEYHKKLDTIANPMANTDAKRSSSPMMSSPKRICDKKRPSNLLIFDVLMSVQEGIFEYFISSITFLDKELPNLMNDKVSFNSTTNIMELSKRLDLIRKFKEKIKYLDKFDQVFKIFQTIFNFIEGDLNHMLTTIKDQDGDELTNVFFHSIFASFTQSLEFSLDNSWIEIGDNEEKLNEMYEILDDLNPDIAISLCKINISNYGQLYSQWKADPIHFELFTTSLKKELSFNPALNYNFDLEYDNSILRKIVNNELNTSPNSYNEEECKVLDVMEILTFHIDSCEMICLLISKFHNIVIKKEKGKAIETNVPLDKNVLNELQVFLKDKIASSIRCLVDGGTMGLSKYTNLTKILDTLTEFNSILQKFTRISFNKVQFFFKEETHFVDVLDKYHDSLELLLNLVLADSCGAKNEVIDINKDEFEELDLTVKDCFFDLTYFNQRFRYEEKIADLVLQVDFEAVVKSLGAEREHSFVG